MPNSIVIIQAAIRPLLALGTIGPMYSLRCVYCDVMYSLHSLRRKALRIEIGGLKMLPTGFCVVPSELEQHRMWVPANEYVVRFHAPFEHGEHTNAHLGKQDWFHNTCLCIHTRREKSRLCM